MKDQNYFATDRQKAKTEKYLFGTRVIGNMKDYIDHRLTYKAKAVVCGKDIYQDYLEYSEKNDNEPLALAVFSRALTELLMHHKHIPGIMYFKAYYNKRSKNGLKVHYYNLAIKD